jgi:hypothetical protein
VVQFGLFDVSSGVPQRIERDGAGALAAQRPQRELYR